MRLNIHECDRCGTIYDEDKMDKSCYLRNKNGTLMRVLCLRLRAAYDHSNYTSEFLDEIQLELCPNCMKEILNNFIVETPNNHSLEDVMISKHKMNKNENSN